MSDGVVIPAILVTTLSVALFVMTYASGSQAFQARIFGAAVLILGIIGALVVHYRRKP